MKKLLYFLLLSMILMGCSNSKEVDSDALRLQSGSDLATLDSGLAVDAFAFEILNATQEGLYRLNKNEKAEPAMALEDPKVSKDGKVYTIKLRKNNKWSNGKPVTANDFVYAWQRVVNPETASEYAYIMYDVKNAKAINEGKMKPDSLGIQAVDDYTLKIELEQAVPYFKELLTFGTFLPVSKEFVEKQGEKYGTTVKNALFSGPFILKEWKIENKLKLVKNKNYWDHKKVKLKEINYKVIKDEQTALNLFETNKLDAVTISSEKVDKYKTDKAFSTRLDSALFYMQFNLKNRYLSNQNLRIALSQAMDKEKYVKTLLNNGSVPADKLTPNKVFTDSNNKDFNDGVEAPYSFNLKAAQSSLSKAKKELNTDNIQLTLLTFDQENAKTDAEYFKEQIEKNLPGVTIKIKQQPSKQKIALTKKGEYDIAYTGWGPDYPDPMTFLDLFVSDTTAKETGYNNPQFDEYILQSKTDLVTQPDVRWTTMQKAENLFLRDAVILPLYQRGTARLTNPQLKNRIIHFVGTTEYKEAYIKK
ncbi:peptide ABC transporter substrate-binding protein [Macrococcoides goetzii]|uniref:Peptide ABC transporter substrate-binding protein n=1 Tax=Macrococcoides goetzii TaxID=1891097 RepID=A0A395GBA3_9STAP|nr:peptide ABC transporter substrate-binding protein [Macrococcus goetzii]RAI81088.1 peptide ABC transporter substrate-binding protein [Macrococcus goetzii]